jgi:3-hydroxymyristoyl/3-hydroxydecanoyl-(acyl carrier protein) dehydratase
VAGHFPGDPIVPAALLLDRAIAHVEHAYARRVTSISVAKFIAPVLPLQVCMLEMRRMTDNAVSVKATVQGTLAFSLSVTLEEGVSNGRGVG